MPLKETLNDVYDEVIEESDKSKDINKLKKEWAQNLAKQIKKEYEEKCCHLCGGTLTTIRGRYPHTPKREVCPTCLADRMDEIHQQSDPNYGKTYQEKEKI